MKRNLKEGVHVASGALVLEAHVACVLLAAQQGDVYCPTNPPDYKK